MSDVPCPEGEIIVAVKADQAAKDLLACGAGLARACGRSLRLVQIDLPDYPMHSLYGYGVHDFGGFSDGSLSDLCADGAGDTAWRSDADDDHHLPLRQRTRHELATTGLRQLAERLTASGIPTQSTVIVGDFPDMLLQHAVARNAALIITGAATRHPGLFSNKLRHIYRLMARTEVPVLVVPDAGKPLVIGTAGSSARLRVLLADDLTTGSVPAIATLTALVGRLHLAVDIVHLHVEPDRNTNDFVLLASAEQEIWPGIKLGTRLVSDHEALLRGALDERAYELEAAAVRRGGTYTSTLWHGPVAASIQRAVHELEPTFCVFGQHHVLRPRTMAWGQMPFGTMLHVDSPVLVAPH